MGDEGTVGPESGNLLGGSLAAPLNPAPPGPPVDLTPSDGNVLSGLMDENLSFKEGWRDVLAKKVGDDPFSAELIETKILDNYKDLPSALKGLIETKKMVGSDKIAKPSEGASQDVWDQYYRAGGKPESPEGYKVEFSEGLEPSEERLKAIQEIAHKANLSNSQLQAMVSFQEQDILNAQKAQEKAISDEMVATTNALHKEWGGAFDIKLRKVGNFFNNLGLGELVEKTGLGRNLEFITAFESQVIDKLSEDTSLLGADEPLAPADISAQIHEALNNPESPFNRNVPGAQEALDNLYIQQRRNKAKK